MNRLSTRLLLSHGVVAVVGGVVAYALVRLLVPRLYDMRAHSMGQMRGGLLARALVVETVNAALVIGVLAGVVTAVLAGAWSARRVMRPLDAVRAATHRLAEGHYAEQVELPEEPELAAVAADVNALARRLAETEARRSRLLGEVAHEMRTPLTVLDGYVEGLIDGVFTPDPETLTALGSELRRLRRLAEDLGSLSRAEERGFELAMAPVDLADVARGVAERLRPQFDDAGVALAVVAPDGGLWVHGDPDRLAQVMTNLLGNSLTATPSGQVRVVAERSGDDAVVSVVDTGVGLDPAELTRVFERFYRAPGTGAGTRRGTGIGLTIARGIVEAHGGRIEAASAGRGRGTTVTVRLPALRAVQAG